MRTYMVDVGKRLIRAVTIGVPDDWDAYRAEDAAYEMAKAGRITLDPVDDAHETWADNAEEVKDGCPEYIADEAVLAREKNSRAKAGGGSEGTGAERLRHIRECVEGAMHIGNAALLLHCKMMGDAVKDSHKGAGAPIDALLCDLQERQEHLLRLIKDYEAWRRDSKEGGMA